MNGTKNWALYSAGNFALLLVAAVFWTASASAGTISSVPAPVVGGPGLGTVAVPAIITVQANNDNVPDPSKLDNNIFVPVKRFDNPGYIDIEFFVSPSDGVTEYKVFESVDNNTGVNWSSYRMELGYGLGAAFTKSIAGDDLDFDFPHYDLSPTSSAMPLVGLPDEDTLVFKGGVHGSGSESYEFRIDVPDIATSPYFSRFTLRQIPIPVPEPSTFALFGIALSGMMVFRSRSSR
ncbi:PEP-CTERM sorting domain-containing protein [Rubripirellula amarantea]|nr:PEP-CTERM sorting domain-containing protein [Rubripirellula amarantea]